MFRGDPGRELEQSAEAPFTVESGAWRTDGCFDRGTGEAEATEGKRDGGEDGGPGEEGGTTRGSVLGDRPTSILVVGVQAE